ncbi:hypothetical protein SAMN05421853_106191 [Roseivivax halotolerans]|jgi:hypothetical protein|uniref:Uncharacterized protein n=1 Tax=Roseivivax halotolerans TaxID=93684 RepID=A0A1I5YR07_9RHOB|nr:MULTISPECIES: hypothetical protein [Roseivivax]QFT61752.1 hypothetical protein FIU91_02325 [Roseivivax sp. THAF30]SFQ46673.1 hypothetical protein SAMN05421853_106191 [Roseivivax halotolerans]
MTPFLVFCLMAITVVASFATWGAILSIVDRKARLAEIQDIRT